MKKLLALVLVLVMLLPAVALGEDVIISKITASIPIFPSRRTRSCWRSISPKSTAWTPR